MLALGNIARQRKLIISGNHFSLRFCFKLSMAAAIKQCLCFVPSPGISYIDFCCAHLVEGQRMIEITMAIRDWILLVHYWVACFEWFVFYKYLLWLFDIKR